MELRSALALRDADMPTLTGHRQVTDAQLLVLARRQGHRLVTFDSGVLALAGDAPGNVELLSAP